MSSKEILKNYFLYFLGLIVLIFVILELAGMQQFGMEIYNIQKNQKVPQKPQMLVVLTGGIGRIEAAYELMRGHDIPLLLIAGVNTKVNFDQLARKYGWDNGYRDRILVDNISKTTWENAKVSEDFARRNNIRDIVLVTSVYHMQRAEFLFRKMFNKGDVKIIPYGTYVQPIEPNSWWRDFSTFQKVIQEYFKFQYYRLMFSGR